jgi:DNA-binding transcriptional regulator YhcF (GntR family)
MLEHLFGSKTRLKLLRLWFQEPDQLYYVRELGRILDVQINGIRREIEALLEAGIIEEREFQEIPTDGKSGASLRKYYGLNRSSMIYGELRALIMKEQAVHEQAFIMDITKKVSGIELLLISGMFTGDDAAPTDLLVVGSFNTSALDQLIKSYESDHRATVRYTAMTEEEFVDRRHMMDKFIFSLFDADHVVVVDQIGVSHAYVPTH